jgi:rhodanese-related sulfurtransferase
MLAFFYGLKSISPAELHRAQQRRAVTVVDVNARLHWEQGHVPGALSLPVEFARGDLPSDPAAPLVFYCSNPLCRKAPTAARRAVQMGHSDVKVMSAGIAGWRAAGLPTEAHVRT